MFKFIFKTILILTLITLIGFGVLGYKFNEFKETPISLETDTIVFEIKSGSHIRKVARELREQSLIENELMLIILAKIEGLETKIKAGEFLVQKGTKPQELLEQFVEGKTIQYSQTIIEGRTFKEFRIELEKNKNLVHTLKGKTAEEIMAALGSPNLHIEGQFLPDTYAFPKGSTDLDLLKRAHKSMQTALNKEWEKREKGLPLKTPYDALILASIIEKETGVAEERPLISAAFITRLRKNMKLQTDPTIIYGMGDRFKGNIRYKDLREDTPYNTYVHRGLTPTPIAMPGLLSIQAALHPAKSDAIFFVSKGNGTHKFSKTLKEHNAAVRKYQLKGRKPKRKATSGK